MQLLKGKRDVFLNRPLLYSCGHECCKIGVAVKEKAASQQNKSTPTTRLDNPGSRKCAMSREVEKHLNDMHAKASNLACTPSLRNIKVRVVVRMHTRGTGVCLDIRVLSGGGGGQGGSFLPPPKKKILDRTLDMYCTYCGKVIYIESVCYTCSSVSLFVYT